MDQLLSHPDGVRLLHDQGRRFDLRIHEQSLIGVFSFRWAYRGLQGQEVDVHTTHLTLSDMVRNRRTHTASVEYPPCAGATAGIRFRIRPNGLEIKPYVRIHPGHLPAPIAVHHMTLEGEDLRSSFLNGFGRDPGWRFFPLGYNASTPVWARDSREVPRRWVLPIPEIFDQHHDSVFWRREDVISTPWMATIQRSGIDSTLLLGFLQAKVSLGEVAVLRRTPPRVVLRADFGGKTLREDTLESDPMCMTFSRDGDRLIETWTEEVGKRMEARSWRGPVPSGWCPRSRYPTRVKERDIHRNLDLLVEQRDILPVRYVQLEDGYQTLLGDWLSTNRRFLGGLKSLARRIKDHGFLPGIWTAPFLVQRGSRVYRHHRDWLLQTSQGKPRWMGYLPSRGLRDGHLYGLDPSHPEVLDHLTETYTALVDMGFEYFKIDCLFTGLKGGRRHDTRVSSVEAYRRGLTRIRDAVGERFLLGCGAPLVPSVGLVDGVCVAPEPWHDPVMKLVTGAAGHVSAELASTNSLTRSFLHKVWWLNAPACLLVGRRRNRLTFAEIQTLVTILSLSGGMLFLGDDLAHLPLERRGLAELALPPRGEPARALDLRRSSRPERFVRRYRGPGQHTEAVGAVINWSDATASVRVSPEDFQLDPGVYHGFELWSDTYQLVSADRPMALRLLPHQSALITFRPVENRPQVVSVTHHAGQVSTVVTEEIWSPDGRLEVALDTGARRQGDVLVSVPAEYQEISAATTGEAGPTGRVSFDAGIRYSVPIQDTGRLLIRFERTRRH